MPTATETRWSPYQEALFDFVENGDGSAIVEAVAGSGKTSTLVECAKRLTEYDNAVAIAFNTRIKDELIKRLPPYVPALTLNALGFRAWKEHIGKGVEVDKFKTANLIRELSNDSTPDYRKGVKRLVDLAKMAGIVPSYVKGDQCTGLRPDDDDSWHGLIEEYGLYFGWGDKTSSAVELGRRVLAESIRVGGTKIDFNDQLYLPVIFTADFTRYDYIFVDEAQDVNEIQRVMIERSASRDCRVFAFGDPAQAIYHFRGAGDNSLPRLKERFSARSMPLSICYRCSKAVVAEAKKHVPAIEAWEGAAEGSVVSLDDWRPEGFQQTDAILCRNNAPLVKLAFRLLRSGKPCKIMGRDIGTGLAALVQKMKAGTKEELYKKLSDYEIKEATKLNPDEMAALTDRIDTIRVFMENAVSVMDVITKIEIMFADETGQYLILSTVHKAKGLEWPRVFILDAHLIGARAESDWERRAEQNVWYVAVTRAQRDLLFIRS